MKELLDKLNAKMLYGTIDRLNRGVITKEQAEAELNGDCKHLRIEPFPEPRGDLIMGRTPDEIMAMQGRPGVKMRK